MKSPSLKLYFPQWLILFITILATFQTSFAAAWRGILMSCSALTHAILHTSALLEGLESRRSYSTGTNVFMSWWPILVVWTDGVSAGSQVSGGTDEREKDAGPGVTEPHMRACSMPPMLYNHLLMLFIKNLICNIFDKIRLMSRFWGCSWQQHPIPTETSRVISASGYGLKEWSVVKINHLNYPIWRL